MYPFFVSALATGKSPGRVGNMGYSGSPAAEYFDTLDGYIGPGANAPDQIGKLFPLLGLSAADAAPHLESGPGFARARDPKSFQDLLDGALMARRNADSSDNLGDDVDAIVVASSIYKLNP